MLQLAELYGDYLIAGNYLALIWFPKPFRWGLVGFGHLQRLFGRGTIWFRIYCASNRHSPTLTAVRDERQRRDDGHDNFHASPRRLDKPNSIDKLLVRKASIGVSTQRCRSA